MMNNASFIPLDVLACDLEARPKGAPGIAQIADAVRSVTRHETSLVVSFDVAAHDDVQAFVEAERQCCADLSWELASVGGATRLTIAARPNQIDVLQQLFASARDGDL